MGAGKPPGVVAAPDPRMVKLSNEMVRLYKELFGRGPSSARSEYAGPDCVVVTLRESMTPAETTLAKLGEHQRLRDTRLYFQHAREADLRDVVEGILGRKVVAFISGIDVERDVSAEIFYLQPS